MYWSRVGIDMLNKIKSFFIKITPSKRKIIQLYAALLYNANIKGFITGNIFEGNSKAACLPGLNCYSCPGAIGACPLGSLQNALAESKTKLPTYILGIILLYSIILGRTICGFLCPFGLIQELLYKIKTPKLKKNKITRVLSYFKYVILVVLVIILPLVYALQAYNIPLPGFCKYICPAGTLEGAVFLLSNPNNSDFFGMLGTLFTWKFTLLIVFIVASVFIFRFFCRFFCPLGALYGLFNKISILGVKVDKSKCTSCHACVNNCKMDVKEVGDHECIQCGDCRKVCHCNAINWKTIHKFVKDDLEKEEENKNIAENNFENKDNEIIFNEEKKTLKISSKMFNRIVACMATVLLVVVLIAVNFKQEKLEINDICDDLKINLNNGEVFDISIDNNTTLLYFTDDFNDDDLEVFKKYSDEKLNIILISNVSISDDLIQSANDNNIKFTKDKNNKLLKMFTDEITYPYSVFIDFSDKILIKKKEIISDSEYISTVSPIILGKSVGNKVGDICINKELNIIGSEEKFSVVDNRGKIVILNFWFTGCTPCVQELPHFNKVSEEYKDVLTMVAIHEASQYNDDPEGVLEFIDTKFSNFSLTFVADDLDSPYYDILSEKQVWPTTIIIDQDGVISFIKYGSLSENDLRTEIAKLIK